MFGAFYGDVIGSETVMTAAVCRAILNNGENIGRFGIRKRDFEYATQYKQNFARYPHAGYGQYVYTLG